MPSLVPLDNTIGAAFIGFALSLIIYGITCLQAYLYYINHSAKDGRFLKTFVAFLVFLDTVAVVLITHALYWYTVSNFGHYEALLSSIWSLDIQVIVSCSLASSVQVFFAWRVYLISDRKNWLAPLMIVIWVLGFMASSSGFVVTAFRFPQFAKADMNIPWSTTSMACELAADTIIAASMIFYFTQRRTGFDRTHTLLNSLIQYSLNTCILTIILTTLNLTFFIKYPRTMLYTPFFAVLMRVYLCSFLSTLNTRQSLCMYHEDSSGVFTTQDSPSSSKIAGKRGQTAGPITVTTTKHVFSDSTYVENKICQLSA